MIQLYSYTNSGCLNLDPSTFESSQKCKINLRLYQFFWLRNILGIDKSWKTLVTARSQHLVYCICFRCKYLIYKLCSEPDP